MLIVQVCDFGSDGDAQYRLHEPSRYLGKLPSVTTIDCHFFSRHRDELADLADVMIIQFVNDWDLTSLCLRRRKAGLVTIFEANDYFLDIQPWNPIAGPWQDRNLQELYLQLLTIADGVQTSTEELARRWRERGAREVAVFPNHLSQVPALTDVGRNAGARQRPLTVGWAGSPGHFADWYYLAPTLQRWLDEHKDVNLAVMTNELAKPFFRLLPERYHFEPFGSLDDYMRFLGRMDVGIAPLLPTDYNRCRSDVKFVEYASRGVVGVYADMEPYRASVVDGQTGLMYRTPGELIDRLELLRTNMELRGKLRRQGYEYVARQRRIEDHIGDRLHWYQGLLRHPAVTKELPEHIRCDAVADGAYWRLAVAKPEQVLIAARRAPSAGEANKGLRTLIQNHPGYLAALQHQGKVLNDLRDHGAALNCLNLARRLRPDSARTNAEIGRARFLLGDQAKAREALEEAIRVNPHYLPAWQYLLRLLSLGAAVDGPAWAQRAERLFPACYPLALLGVAAYPAGEAAGVTLCLLERHVPGLRPSQRAAALAVFRPSILAAVRGSPDAPKALSLLERACELFPESPLLAGELGSALYRLGMSDEAWMHYQHAMNLHRQAAVDRMEFKGEESPPYLWQFAEHIRESYS